MRVNAYIFLVVFISFIAVPSVIAIIDDEENYSIAYSDNEEENNLEINAQFKFTSNIEAHYLVPVDRFEQELFFHNHRQNYCSIYLDITSPPPRYL